MTTRIHMVVLRASVMVLLLTYALQPKALDLSNTPLFVPKPVPPNLALTLDDSASMRWAFVPDLCGSNWVPGLDPVCAVANAKRYKSAHFNALYYNPDVSYPPPIRADGSTLSTSFTSALINGFDSTRGSVNLETSFRPTAAYNPSSTSQTFAQHPDDGFLDRSAGVHAYYYVFDTTLANCDITPALQADDDDCYRKVAVPAEQKQNFANWYSFYRTRNLMTVTAVSRAFAGLPDGVRVAWQALNSCRTSGGGTTVGSLTTASCQGWDASITGVSNAIAPFTGTHRSNFYTWLFRLPASGGTPLRGAMRRAGEYFKLSAVDGPYDNEIGVDDESATGYSGQYACRPNFHVLMTDGMWNDANPAGLDPAITLGNYDNNPQTLGDQSTTYTAQDPYRDSYENTLADLTFYYWANDLRDDLDNKLIPYIVDRDQDGNALYWSPKNDPAKWQHLSNYFIGLGLSGSLNVNGLPWAGDTYSGAYVNLVADTHDWPAAGEDLPGNVYDLWHAALNSRGQFFSSESPDKLNDAFVDVLQSIQEQSSAASATVANSGLLQTDTVIYQAGFNSLDWTGTLTAYSLNPATGEVGSVVWEASDQLESVSYDSRSIFTWDPLETPPRGEVFAFANLSSDQSAALVANSSLVNYLRGDKSMEGTWRRRSGKLGDIINSDPTYVAAPDFGYETLTEGLASGSSPYRDFVIDNLDRTKMVYVGSNDGMLHGFRASDGGEVFAYMPNAAILAQDSDGTYRMASMRNTNYGHRFFVDGSPFVGDAYIGSSWKTVLVSGMGAGGRAVFALDVTDPGSFNASKVMWEFTHANLGYTFSQPIIVRLNNGRWAAIVGNGYPDNAASSTATAKLFIVYLDADLSDGWTLNTDYVVIATNSQTANGLSSPVAYDSNNDRITDYIYAGDLQGNIWKFDLSNASAASWGVAYDDGGSPATPEPLFSARDSSGNVQPITAPLELGKAPTGRSGLIVYFGTGRFLADGDNITSGALTQSFYGIYDNFSAAVVATDRSTLQEQTILTSTASISGVSFELRVTSNNTVDYDNKRGWYMDLPATGERVVSIPLLRHGRVIFTTLIPSPNPCDFGGDSWLMEVTAENGQRPDEPVFDFANSGSAISFDDLDKVTYGGSRVSPSGLKSPVGIIDIPAVLSEETSEVKIAFGTRENAGSRVFRIREAGGLTRSGRVSWREIID